LSLRRRKQDIAVISLSLTFLFLVLVTTPTIAKSQTTITATGQMTVVDINEFFGTTMHFAPTHPIFVQSGSTILLKDTTNDFHTLTFVTAAGLPKNATDVLNCGAPGTVCGAALAAHGISPALPPPNVQGAPPSYTGACQTFDSSGNPVPPSTNPPVIFTCLSKGVGVQGSYPSIGTPFNCSSQTTCSANGDSIVVLPNGVVPLKITAPSGTVLHFLCVFHPWMQGEIIVTNS
jgi:hypothetical protein